MNDPPVGWLVIVGGPGMGHVAMIGMGVNAIGRDATDRVSLDYGDKMISRTRHALVTFDPRSRKFYIQHGGGTNLTYLNDEPVLAPRELEPLTHVQIRGHRPAVRAALRRRFLLGGPVGWSLTCGEAPNWRGSTTFSRAAR